MADEVLQAIQSVFGHRIRLTAIQWSHINESHDYMAGNLSLVLETLAEPDDVIEGSNGEALALRRYLKTVISSKTAVVIYRDEPDGFVITAFLTSRPDKIRKRGKTLWPISSSPEA